MKAIETGDLTKLNQTNVTMLQFQLEEEILDTTDG